MSLARCSLILSAIIDRHVLFCIDISHVIPRIRLQDLNRATLTIQYGIKCPNLAFKEFLERVNLRLHVLVDGRTISRKTLDVPL